MFSLWGIPMTYIENSGMAGGLLQGYGRLFGVVSVLFVAGVIYFRKKGAIKGRVMELGFAFLVGGAIGNGIDRLLFGQVTDFLLTRRNGVLNVADHAIEIGVVLVVCSLIIEFYQDWRKRRSVQ